MSLLTEPRVSVMDKPRKRGRPPKDMTTESVRLPTDILAKARLIALVRKLKVSEYLSQLIRGPLDRDWKDARRQIAEKD